MKNIESVVDSLVANNVEFVIVGGVAIIAHGVPYATFDLDFCCARTTENLKKIVNALTGFQPRLRDFPKELPFVWTKELCKAELILLFKPILATLICLGRSLVSVLIKRFLKIPKFQNYLITK